MTHFSILLISLFVLESTMAQVSGLINYTETMQLQFEAPEGMNIEGLINNSMTTNKELLFTQEEAIYQTSKSNVNEDQEITNDEGTFKMVIETGENENIDYLNIKAKKHIYQTSFMGKLFLIESDQEKQKWKLTDEKVKYLGYVCHKAELTIPAKDEESEDKHVVAWFTTEIPASVGPNNYGQLPGAILMINENDGDLEIKATSIELRNIQEGEIKIPRKGKKVSSEEFEIIVEEQMKEMQEMYQSNGSTTIIRG